MNDLDLAEELLREARENRPDIRKYLQLIRDSMISSFRAGLGKLGIEVNHESVHRLYLSVPYAYRPSVGEPELEEFEFRYGLITSNELEAIKVDERFLDASMDLAERVYFWAESLTKKL